MCVCSPEQFTDLMLSETGRAITSEFNDKHVVRVAKMQARAQYETKAEMLTPEEADKIEKEATAKVVEQLKDDVDSIRWPQ